MIRNVLLVMVLVALAAVLTAVPAAAETVRIAVPTDPDSFDPHKSVAAATGEIAFNIYEGLVRAAPDGSVVPAAASDWEVQADGTHYRFYLRDMYFHDGSSVGEGDVVYSLNRLRDPDISGRAQEYDAIEKVEAGDGYVDVILERPHGPFLASLAETVAAIIPEGAEDLEQNPIGTGPYRFVDWRPNQDIRLERFDDHWKEDKPYFSQVVFAIYPDDSSAIMSLRSGQVHVIPRLEPALSHQVAADPSLEMIPGPMNLVQLLVLNNGREPFDNPDVRRALAKAVDRGEMIEGAAWGHGTPVFSGISPAMEMYFAEGLGSIHERNLEEARRLLQKAGHGDLRFTLDLPAPYEIHVQTGEMIAQQLAAIGVEVELQIIEWGTWLERVYNQRDYDATVVGLAGRLDPHSILVRYQSDSGRNFFNFSHSEYDDLIAKGMQAADEERPAIYKEAQRILAEEAAAVFIMDPEQLAVTDGDIRGWHNYPVYVIDAASLYR